MIKTEIRVPLLNANEPEARLAAIHVQDGQSVRIGQLLFTVETTKATSDLEATADGFIRLSCPEGDVLNVGDCLGVITETADEPLPALTPMGQTSQKQGLTDLQEPRITQPARRLAELMGVDLASLPADQLITEQVVRQVAALQGDKPLNLPISGEKAVIVFGAGGHAKSIIEMVDQGHAYQVAGIVDDNPALTGEAVLGYPVLGTRLRLPAILHAGVRQAVNGVGGILDIGIRVRIFETLLAEGFSLPPIFHPRAILEPSAKCGEGVLVFANAYIGSDAHLEAYSMVNTNAVISHDCRIGRYTHIAPGALLAGHVHVGERCLVGMGVTTAIGVRIGDGVRIGNGANILADVPDRTIIQAGRFWTGKPE